MNPFESSISLITIYSPYNYANYVSILRFKCEIVNVSVIILYFVLPAIRDIFREGLCLFIMFSFKGFWDWDTDIFVVIGNLL